VGGGWSLKVAKNQLIIFRQTCFLKKGFACWLTIGSFPAVASVPLSCSVAVVREPFKNRGRPDVAGAGRPWWMNQTDVIINLSCAALLPPRKKNNTE